MLAVNGMILLFGGKGTKQNKEKEVAAKNDYRLTIEDIKQFEAEFGKIPVVFARGWSACWKDISAFYNQDENVQVHTPG